MLNHSSFPLRTENHGAQQGSTTRLLLVRSAAVSACAADRIGALRRAAAKTTSRPVLQSESRACGVVGVEHGSIVVDRPCAKAHCSQQHRAFQHHYDACVMPCLAVSLKRRCWLRRAPYRLHGHRIQLEDCTPCRLRKQPHHRQARNVSESLHVGSFACFRARGTPLF